MKRQMTVGYQNRTSIGYGGTGVGTLSRDLPTAPKLVIANHFLTRNGFPIGQKVIVHYSPNQIIIRKLN